MNLDERIRIPSVKLLSVGLFRITLPNVFGSTLKEYDIEPTNKPYLVCEDGAPMLWEDKSIVLLEQQKMRVWRQRARR